MNTRTFGPWAMVASLWLIAACGDNQEPVAPSVSLGVASVPNSVAAVVRQLAAQRGVGPLIRPAPVRESLVRLGQALVFDRELSGNRDISCMTCHFPTLGTGDARSLAIGQGATGFGQSRVHPNGEFIPRNAPPLFNLGSLKSLFWDGRVSVDGTGGFHTPAGLALTPAMTNIFEFGPASALGLFPVTSREEMRAQSGNELALIPDDDLPAIWRGLMRRLGRIPEYRRLFEAAYPGTRFEQMTFAHASNAMGGFFVSQFSFNNAPWDRFLKGDDRALNTDQLAGAQTFMSIRCSLCHNGPVFSDNKFHNVAVPQFGPGKGNGPNGRDDFGRMNVSGLAAEKYVFRTTPLRNVVLTGPYGHDGAFLSLRGFIDHYSQSDLKLLNFNPGTLEPLLQGTLVQNFADLLATRDTLLNGVVLPDATIDQLTAFMTALTDPAAVNLGRTVPRRVPSGLAVDRP